jgi:hypothetical protein
MTSHRVVGGKLIWIFASILLLVAIPAFAQLPVGTILGTVKDATGAVVPGATVMITNSDTQVSRTLTTAADGTYRAPELPVGHYLVKAEHEGFKAVTHTGITLNVSEDDRIDFSLEVGSTTQEVSVTGEPPIVNTQDASLGALVNEQYMSDLPVNGRNYVSLALIEPGVTNFKNSSAGSGKGNVTTSYPEISVNGAPPAQTGSCWTAPSRQRRKVWDPGMLQPGARLGWTVSGK